MSYQETDIQNWKKEEILEWIKSIGLSDTWEELMIEKVNEFECTGKDLIALKNGKELGESLEIQNPMLSNRIYREIKNLKQPNSSQSDLMEDIDNKPFRVNIYAQSQTWIFENATSNTLIYDIKQWYKQQSGDDTPMYDMMFTSNNGTLNDNQTLGFYGINDDSNLITVEFNTPDNWDEYATMFTNVGFINVPSSSNEADKTWNQMVESVDRKTKNTPSKITTREQLIDILQQDGFYTNESAWLDANCPPIGYENYAHQQPAQQYNPPPSYSSSHDDLVVYVNANNNPIAYPNANGQVDANIQNQNQQGLFGNFFLRTVYMSAAICVGSMLSFRFWFSKSPSSAFDFGFGSSAFGAVTMCVGAALTLICTLIRRRETWLKWSMIIMYGTGGAFYFFGACGIANGWNSIDVDVSSSIAGIFFAEQSFLAFHAMLAGFDLYQMEMLNDKKTRVALYNLMFLGLALIDFFSYAVLSSTFDTDGIDNGIIAYLATFYFLAMIPSGLIMILYLKQRGQEISTSVKVLNILMAMFSISLICIVIGYSVLTVKYYGTFLGDRIGVFVLFTGIIIAMDISFDRFIPPCNIVNRNERQYESIGSEQSLKQPLL